MKNLDSMYKIKKRKGKKKEHEEGENDIFFILDLIC
jgi:hypothetical protein